MLRAVLGELLPIVSTDTNGLYPQKKAEIAMTGDKWYEVSFDGTVFISILHPYEPIVAMVCIRNEWASANVRVKEMMAGIYPMSNYIKVPMSNTIKKVYVKGSDAATRIKIIPLEISNNITVKVTSDDMSGL